MNSNSRVYGEVIELDTDNVREFYDKRAANESNRKYSSVLLQDGTPELVDEQLRIEKDIILPKLNIDTHSKVLDIACGVGRWGEVVVPVCDYYYGIDFSENMIRIAEERLSKLGRNNYKLECASFQEAMGKKPETLFNRVIISGVLSVISDDDIKECLKKLLSFLHDDCAVFIWDLCGIDKRLTLKDHYSKSLNDNFNAIYRAKSEYDNLFKVLTNNGFSLSFLEYYAALGGTSKHNDTDKVYYIFTRGNYNIKEMSQK